MLRPFDMNPAPFAVEPPEDPSSPLAQVGRLAARVAPSHLSVLILGETGVGKDVWARRIHALSRRNHRPFVAINCAGLTATLIESELFGHERGAFTGAAQRKPGLLEMAEGGTVFLDEIGEMPLGLQAKLLRAVENREILSVGAIRHRRIDVRFIAATNRCLDLEVTAGRFRADLLARLDGMTVTIPPLRERRSEIGRLARTFLAEASRRAGRAAPALSPAVLARLEAQPWPGNVRELRNVIERALLFCDGPVLDHGHLAAAGLSGPPLPRSPVSPVLLVAGARPDRERVAAALSACGGNQTRAARLLGIPRRTFLTRLDAYGLPRPRKRRAEQTVPTVNRPAPQ
jgi:two-component system response regulator AtoC